MDVSKIKAALALGFTGALSVSNASVNMPQPDQDSQRNIVAISSPDLKVTVYDGIATLFGIAESDAAAKQVEAQIAEVDGIDYVINMITSDDTTINK